MGTDKKINVCHLISGDLWAGAEVQMYTLVSSLKTAPELNISAIILNEGKLARKLKETGLDATVVDESKHGFYKILSLIKEKLQGEDIDIIHTHRYKENLIGGLLKRKGVVRHLVQTVHGLGETPRGFRAVKSQLLSRANLWFARKYFDKVLTVSFDIQKNLSHKIDSARLETIHNAINPADLKVTKESTELRKEFGVGKDESIIGTAGRMVPVKGYDLLLDAAALILKRKPTVRFLLAGEGPQRTELEQKAKAMGFSEQIQFVGFRDDIIDFINCLDLFIMSSYHEGIPMVLLEAMVLRKAIVATAVGGINEIIENGVSGLLVKSGNAEAFAEACIRVLDDAGTRSELETGAAKRIDKEFSIDTAKERMLNVYRSLAGMT